MKYLYSVRAGGEPKNDHESEAKAIIFSVFGMEENQKGKNVVPCQCGYYVTYRFKKKKKYIW